ncbi:MAG: hypothetical protein GY937_21385 [bacterium]|nr:hypothetical protein [bacterium]
MSGPPGLEPFGLVLHHDGRWSHEGQPILHQRLREHFDRSVLYLPEERKYIVTLGHFRGEIEVEECGFFVRVFDPATGRIELSDHSHETLEPATLRSSAIDGVVICQVKRDLRPEGLPARFTHGAHSELMLAVAEEGEGFVLVSAGQRFPVDLG